MSAGVDFELGSNVYLTSAIQLHLGYFKPKKSITTKAVQNGEDVLSKLQAYFKEIEYEDEFTRSSSGDVDFDKPAKELAVLKNYSSIGLMLGVRFVLN